MKEIFDVCMQETSSDPLYIFEKIVSQPFCPMHSPIHHVIVGSALLTAYKNAGGDIDLPTALAELEKRAVQVPGGACGLWGACGAGVSTGMFISIVTDSSPLKTESWGLANRMTAYALARIGATGGPRCCKRDSYSAILEAVAFVNEHLGVPMTATAHLCTRHAENPHCIRTRCPYFHS